MLYEVITGRRGETLDLAEFARLADALRRITSYNVCYTKLLRLSKNFALQGLVVFQGRRHTSVCRGPEKPP